jgi:hypothetical protein
MTNYINDLESQPIMTRDVNESTPFHHDKVEPGWHSGLTTGKFGGLNSSGNIVEADSRAAVKIFALGAFAMNCRLSWSGGGLSGNKDYNYMDLYEEYLTFKHVDFNFDIGKPIYLSSGGGITQNIPNVTGDIYQQVAWAVSSNEYAIRITAGHIVGNGP